MKHWTQTATLALGALGTVLGSDVIQAQPVVASASATPSPPAAAAPNVVWILLDDVGYGAASAFGGLIETPTLDALAAQGLRYTNFHTTAISSPTRAALLTGRNHHSVGHGLFPETAIDHPGYNARIPANKGTVAENLRSLGYNTFAVGKWHLTPIEESTSVGPFTHWPTGKGFDHFFGFQYGETDQWHPLLVEDTHSVATDPKGRHLNELLTDRAIRYVANSKSIAPHKPFFLYLAPGATHAPHQVGKEWIARYKGKFDAGWDAYREQVFARQKQLGVIPATAKLPDRSPNVKAWNSLSPDEQRLFARYFETYAGFLSYTDAEIGRLVNYLKRTGQYDNTVFAVVIGDNGASKEGTDVGTLNGLTAVLNPNKEIGPDLLQIDQIGSDHTSANYPLGWAQATNVPFRQWKQDANAEGGTRNPLILTWPQGIRDPGGIRHQYSHVIDLLPTTLELAGLSAPQVIGGVAQTAFEGTSLAYSVNAPAAPARRTVQYYEINGTRAIYSHGWKAATLHKPGTPFANDEWELYNLDEDPTELNDVAYKHPQKLSELQALFDSEAKKYNVLPLKDSLFRDFAQIRSPFKGRQVVELFPGLDPLFSMAAPRINTGNFDLTAEVVIPPQGAEGVLVAHGGRFGGSSLYLQDGHLHYSQTDGVRLSHLVSDRPVSPGAAKLRLEFRSRFLTSATVRLFINDQPSGEAKVPLTFGFAYFAYDEGFNLGADLQTAVDARYAAPYPYTGQLDKVTIHYP